MASKVVYGYFDGEECFYIGIGSPKRPYRPDHKGRNDFTKSKIKKARKNKSFLIQILHSGLTKEQACWYERMYIQAVGRRDLGLGTLTNLTDGGDHYQHSEVTKQKIRETKQGKRLSESHRKSISQGQKKRKYSVQDCKRLTALGQAQNIKKMKPIFTPFGVYNCIPDAVKQLKLSRGCIRNRIKSKSFPEWYLI